MEVMEEDIVVTDQIQVNIKECFVYQIPALRTSQGHRAEDWKLESPLFTGGLRVYQRNDSLRVIVYRVLPLSLQPTDDSPYSIFAECPIAIEATENDMVRFVDGVVDSSRYFVLRVKDSHSERTTYIGIGFRERDTAFEFKNCLNDYIRYINRREQAKLMAQEATQSKDQTSDSNSSPKATPDKPSKLALKEGEKLSLKLGSITPSEHRVKSATKPTAGSGGAVPLLRKPSLGGEKIKENLPLKPAADDDEWGDFVTSA